MIGRKLIKLLKALSPEEFRRMRKIFQSPIYTSNPDHLKCYDALRRYYPKFKPSLLKKEAFFDKIWEGESFDDWKLRNLFRELTRLTEDYLLLLEQVDPKERQKKLTVAYGKRNLYDFFEKGTKSLLAELEASPYRDKNYYLQKALLNEAWYAHPLKDRYDEKDTSFEDGMDSLDQYFIHAKMQYGIVLKSMQRILNKPYEFRFMELLEKQEREGAMKENSVLQLFWWSLNLESTLQTIDFERYEELLFESFAQLRKEDQKVLFFHGLNYIIHQANRGDHKFKLIAFEWHKKGITYQLIFDGQSIDAIHYSNSITYACKVKAFTWAFNFMQDYQQYLEAENRTFILNYNLAKWHYYQKEFEQILPLLIEYRMPIAYELTYRNLMIRTIFELFLKDNTYFDLLNQKLLSFEKYLEKRKNFSLQKKAPHRNQLKIIHKLTGLLMKNEEKIYIKKWLLGELNQSTPISGRDWLMEKAASLI